MNTSNRILVCFLVSIGALLAAGCGRGGHEHAENAHEEGKHVDHSEPDHTTISAKMAEEMGIRTARLAAGLIRDMHEVQGLLTPVEGKHARIRARFAGPVKAVLVGVGDTVKAGQSLATVESNVSLSEYPVVAPFSGTILSRSASAGDLANDNPLFELADLSALWVDLHIFGADAQHISAGLPVEVMRLTDDAVAITKLDRILPGAATASQSTIARATIRNDDGHWRPGTAVRAKVTVDQRTVELAVPLSALQMLGGQTVVFVRAGDIYAGHPVKLGERDDRYAEVLEGLKLGDEVVIEESYLIKADIEKVRAAHED